MLQIYKKYIILISVFVHAIINRIFYHIQSSAHLIIYNIRLIGEHPQQNKQLIFELSINFLSSNQFFQGNDVYFDLLRSYSIYKLIQFLFYPPVTLHVFLFSSFVQLLNYCTENTHTLIQFVVMFCVLIYYIIFPTQRNVPRFNSDSFRFSIKT